MQTLLTAQTSKSKFQVRFWLSLSLTFAAFYSFLGWREAFSSEYVVQDDARQHVFWMLRFLDAELFPQDLIANYFQSVAPPGYTAFYQAFAAVGINPLLLNKLLPSVLGLITTGYCFGICLQLFPVPAAGFTVTLLLNQILWIKDDLVSATPRAFAYPLFSAVLYYLLRRSLLGMAVAIALLGLFYPHYVLVSVGILILRLWSWDGRRSKQSDYLMCATGIGVALLVLLPYALKSSEFGPAITATEARQLPEFLPKGRTQFFHENPWTFWLNGQRSGVLPRTLFTPVTLCAGLLLPVLQRFPSQFPLVRRVTSEITLLAQMALASLVMFFAAHALLFKLHVPSRYTGQSLRMIMSLAAGIAFIVMLDAVLQWAGKRASPRLQMRRQFLAVGAIVLVGATLVFYPSFIKGFPLAKYEVGEVPALYEFFQKQPKDTLIASLAEEANNLPAFSRRSIFVGREYAIPYQVGYYHQFRQRTLELIRVQYSQDLAQVQDFIQKYGVDFWLLDRTAFTHEYIANNAWVRQYQPAATEVLEKLDRGITPALSKMMKRCSVFETEDLVVLQAKCTVEGEREN